VNNTGLWQTDGRTGTCSIHRTIYVCIRCLRVARRAAKLTLMQQWMNAYVCALYNSSRYSSSVGLRFNALRRPLKCSAIETHSHLDWYIVLGCGPVERRAILRLIYRTVLWPGLLSVETTYRCPLPTLTVTLIILTSGGTDSYLGFWRYGGQQPSCCRYTIAFAWDVQDKVKFFLHAFTTNGGKVSALGRK